jgi:hypothetical protein
MQSNNLPPPSLRSGAKAALLERILSDETLTDDQAQIATALLALGTDELVSVSPWVAIEMFGCTLTEWDEAVVAIEQAGLANVVLADKRVVLSWRAS